MESLFIHPENQTVLWNIIQRSTHWPEFSRTYTKISSPEQWFRQCIEAQYRKIKDLRSTACAPDVVHPQFSPKVNSYELRSPEFPRTPSAARPEYFTPSAEETKFTTDLPPQIFESPMKIGLSQEVAESEAQAVRSKSAIFAKGTFDRKDEVSYENLPKISTPELSKKKWLLAQNKEVLQTMTSEIQEFVKYSGGKAVVNSKIYGGKAVVNSKIYGGEAVANSKIYGGEAVANSKIYGGEAVANSPTLVYSSSRNYDIPPISAFDMEQERKAKYEKAKLEFEQYQTQYNRLLQPFTPPAPDFSETGAQSKIGNMEELLIIQQKMRETDYDMFSPPPPPPDRENIRKEVEEGLDKKRPSSVKSDFGTTPPFDQIDTDKRSVSWSPALFT
jgi:hypothetical protein